VKHTSNLFENLTYQTYASCKYTCCLLFICLNGYNFYSFFSTVFFRKRSSKSPFLSVLLQLKRLFFSCLLCANVCLPTMVTSASTNSLGLSTSELLTSTSIAFYITPEGMCVWCWVYFFSHFLVLDQFFYLVNSVLISEKVG